MKTIFCQKFVVNPSQRLQLIHKEKMNSTVSNLVIDTVDANKWKRLE